MDEVQESGRESGSEGTQAGGGSPSAATSARSCRPCAVAKRADARGATHRQQGRQQLTRSTTITNGTGCHNAAMALRYVTLHERSLYMRTRVSSAESHLPWMLPCQFHYELRC